MIKQRSSVSVSHLTSVRDFARLGTPSSALRRANDRSAFPSASPPSPRVRSPRRSPLTRAGRPAGPRPSASVIANDHIHISAPTNGSAAGAAARTSYFIERQKFISSPAHHRPGRRRGFSSAHEAVAVRDRRTGSLDHIRRCSYNITEAE